MRIVYALTEDEFVEACFASTRNKATPWSAMPRRDRWATRVIWTLVTAMALVVVIVTAILASARADDFGWRSFAGPIHRFEWAAPYLAWTVINLTLARVAPRGQASLRVACVPLAILLVAMGAVLIWSSFADSSPSLLDDFGVFRFLIWTPPVMTLASATRNVWTNASLRVAYATSLYARAADIVVELDESGVRERFERVTIDYRWTAFASVRRSASLVLLVGTSGQTSIMIPKRAIGDARQVDEVVDVLRSRIETRTHAFAVDVHPSV